MKTTRWSMMFAVGLVGVVASLACAQSYDELRWQAERLRRDRDAVEARYAGALQAQARARADLDAASADMARADGRGEVPQREQIAADLSDMRQRLDVAVAMATLDAMLTEPYQVAERRLFDSYRQLADVRKRQPADPRAVAHAQAAVTEAQQFLDDLRADAVGFDPEVLYLEENIAGAEQALAGVRDEVRPADAAGQTRLREAARRLDAINADIARMETERAAVRDLLSECEARMAAAPSAVVIVPEPVVVPPPVVYAPPVVEVVYTYSYARSYHCDPPAHPYGYAHGYYGREWRHQELRDYRQFRENRQEELRRDVIRDRDRARSLADAEYAHRRAADYVPIRPAGDARVVVEDARREAAEAARRQAAERAPVRPGDDVRRSITPVPQPVAPKSDRPTFRTVEDLRRQAAEQSRRVEETRRAEETRRVEKPPIRVAEEPRRTRADDARRAAAAESRRSAASPSKSSAEGSRSSKVSDSPRSAPSEARRSDSSPSRSRSSSDAGSGRSSSGSRSSPSRGR